MAEVIPFVIAGAQIFSTISQVVGAGESAKASENEARIAETQGLIEERNLRREHQRAIGKQRAQIGASGLELSGSPLEVLLDSVREAEFDALTGRYGTKTQAEAARTRARQARGAIPGIIIGGAAKVAGGSGLMSNWFGESAMNARSSEKFARSQTLYD